MNDPDDTLPPDPLASTMPAPPPSCDETPSVTPPPMTVPAGWDLSHESLDEEGSPR